MVEGADATDATRPGGGTSTSPTGAAGTARPGVGDWPSDPVDVLARVFALRRMADLGGFPHMPDWDRMEEWAKAELTPVELRGSTREPESDSGVPLVEVADPFLAFAELSAARLVADEEGLAQPEAWNETERAVREQLSRSHDTHPDGDVGDRR